MIELLITPRSSTSQPLDDEKKSTKPKKKKKFILTYICPQLSFRGLCLCQLVPQECNSQNVTQVQVSKIPKTSPGSTMTNTNSD